MSMEIKPIAYIENDFTEKFGIPRQSGRAPSVLSKIIFTEEYSHPDFLRGIEEFSHLWLIFDFSKAHKDQISPLIRPPRLGGNKKVGVFASRSPFRPNNLGLSSVKLVKVEKGVLTVSGADLMSGTPIYDIKPYIPFTDCHSDAISSYADQNKDYKLTVEIPNELRKEIPEDKLNPIIECLADDPRPSYQDDGREYGMKFGSLNVKFTVANGILTVNKIEK